MQVGDNQFQELTTKKTENIQACNRSQTPSISSRLEEMQECPRFQDYAEKAVQKEQAHQQTPGNSVYPRSQNIRSNGAKAQLSANIPQREYRFPNPANNSQRPLSQFHQRELDYLKNQGEDLRARLQKKNRFLTLEKEKRMKAEQESQINWNQLYYLTNKVQDYRRRKKTSHFGERQEDENRKRIWKLLENVCRVRPAKEKKKQFQKALYEQELKDMQEHCWGTRSFIQNMKPRSDLRQVEPLVGNLGELENLKKWLETEIKSNQDLKSKLRS